jgi:hypothetical protein
MLRFVRAILATPPVDDEPLSLFTGDGLHRLLSWLGVEGRERPDLLRRAVWGVVLTWAPLVLLARWSDNLLVAMPDALAGRGPQLPGALANYVPRESLFLDLAAYAQFVGFIPLAFFAEGFIGGKIHTALSRLRPLAHGRSLHSIAQQASRMGRAAWVDLLIIVIAVGATWSWAYPELHNGLDSWHTSVVAPASEDFTPAGYWAAWFALPFFTYLWMRWVWKVFVWSFFLYRVSRLPLALRAAHPDRTGGLGCLSDVQTSFAAILFGTGVLFAAWGIHKFVFERTPLGSMDVWGPILFYIFLAPGAFIGPLFLFTKKLARVKREGLVRYGDMAIRLASRFERRWLRVDRKNPDELLESPQPSTYADFSTAYQIVESMRVVPFDRRSFIELFSASATPFTPLVFLLELPDKIRNLVSLLGG